MLSLPSKIEGFLFYTTKPFSRKQLADIFQVSKEEVEYALDVIKKTFIEQNRGIVLVDHNAKVVLGTHPELSGLLEEFETRDISEKLSQSALETLSIVAYSNGITKIDLDFIRGVNSQFMLRNLLVRGLVEKKENPLDKRRPLYIVTHDFLMFLGISSIEELPQYGDAIAKIQKAKEQQETLSSS